MRETATSREPGGPPGAESGPVEVWQAGAFGAALDELPVVAVLRAARYGDGGRLADGLVRGGIRAIEFTLTGHGALEAIAAARRVPRAVVGAGSVTEPEQARRAVAAGAQFVVCPIRSVEVAKAQLGVPIVLAGATPTELYEAWKLTGSPVKLFPASGPEQVAAVNGPLPHVPLMPSGGVDGSNARDFLDAGAHAVNVGSSLCPPAALEAADGDLLASRARDLVAAVRRGPT